VGGEWLKEAACLLFAIRSSFDIRHSRIRAAPKALMVNWRTSVLSNALMGSAPAVARARSISVSGLRLAHLLRNRCS
jgi:hypothetical protein